MLEFVFKSGERVTVDAQDWEYKKDGFGGRSLTWNNPRNAKRRLVMIDLDEIVCIVEVK